MSSGQSAEFSSLLSLLIGASAVQLPATAATTDKPTGKTGDLQDQAGRKSDRKQSPDTKGKDSEPAPLMPLPPTLPQAKPPIQLHFDHILASGPSRETLVAEPAETSEEEGDGAPASPPPIAAEKVSIQAVPNSSQAGQLVFAAQLREFDSPQATESDVATAKTGKTSAPNQGNSPGLASYNPGPAISTKAGDESNSGDERQPSKEPAKELLTKQVEAAVSDNLATPKTDPGATLTASRPPAAPSPSSPAGAPKATTEIIVPSKSEINSSARPQPAKEISVRVPMSDATVDLKVTENAGKVQVSVRSADPELTRSIQSGIGDLVGHLEKKGYETETWVPPERSSAAPTAAETSSANTESGNSQQRWGGGTQQQNDGRQQGQDQGQRPKWLDELEFGFSTENSSGENVQ